MPRVRRADRWNHPLYKIGFCLNRGGVVYTEINQQRHSTGLVWDARNKKAALQILEARVREYLEPAQVVIEEPQIVTVGDALREFARIHFPKVSRDTVRIIKNSFDAYLPNSALMLANTEGIRDEILRYVAERGHHVNTQHKYLSWLAQFFRFCIEERYCERNPIKSSMLPKKIKAQREAFSDEELQQLIGYFEAKPEKHEFSLLLRFIACTGVRIAEALSIHWSDIDERRIIIHGKGNRQREFPLSPFPNVIALLRECAAYKEANNDKLFRWKAYAILELWIRRALEELGIKGDGRNFHSIRKRAENNWTDELPLQIAATLAGHSVRVQESNYLERHSVGKLEKAILEARSR